MLLRMSGMYVLLAFSSVAHHDFAVKRGRWQRLNMPRLAAGVLGGYALCC
jgi:hypothetical protein